MKPKSLPLIEQLKERIAARPAPPPRNWLTRLPPEVQEQLLAIKAEWRDGKVQSTARALANDIVACCKESGIVTCGHETMRAWLTKD